MQHHAHTGAIALAAAILAANLPDPHQPTIILLIAGLGALVGTTIGRIHRLPREQTRELAEDASFAGGVVGAALYLAALITSIAGPLHWTHTTASALLAAILTIAVIGLSSPFGGDSGGGRPEKALLWAVSSATAALSQVVRLL